MNDARNGDGSARVVVRIGDTVRRPAGYWTPAVHALLSHLEKVGFEGAPRVIGLDPESEILTYVEGETLAADAAFDDDILVSVGALLRSYHDAAASFTPPTWARWKSTSGPTAGALVCHNDLCVGNVVFRNRKAIGIIDFDFAHPADPSWDLAVAAWHWVPFSTDSAGGQVPESDWPARLRLLVDSYGVESRRRHEVLIAAADLTRRMRDNRARDGLDTGRFDLSLDALDRQRTALIDALG